MGYGSMQPLQQQLVVANTVTVKSQAELLPLQSVATQCTGVVVPVANTLCEGGVQTMVRLEQQLSVAVTTKFTGVFVQDVTTMLDGQWMRGGIRSEERRVG